MHLENLIKASVMSYLEENYPCYDCDENGNIYKNGTLVKPFKSNKYYQVCLFDGDNKKRVVGVHTVVAMKYLDFFEGCVVHHIDENTHNNNVKNLVVMSRSNHCREHGLKNEYFKNLNKGKASWNKGMKMSDEFRRHCSEAAIIRHSIKKAKSIAV